MRTFLGWLTFPLTVAFAAGLFVTLARYGNPIDKVARGSFGFGVATVAGGAATAALWDGSTAHQKLFGGVATIAGIVYALFVLMGLAGLVLSPEDVGGPTGWLIVRLVGLGVASAVCVGYGIAVLYKAEGRAL
ncbi:MAG TPA: hypothetical protein VF746_08810 [Longimicrobium sp.]|jgi:FtsH-binding integral membrane protein